jgi:hypothetical protein
LPAPCRNSAPHLISNFLQSSLRHRSADAQQ